MKLLFTFGKDDFEAVSKKFAGEAADVSNKVMSLVARGKYLYEVCNDQQVYRVADEDKAEYELLAKQVEGWFGSDDESKYKFARHLKFWM